MKDNNKRWKAAVENLKHGIHSRQRSPSPLILLVTDDIVVKKQLSGNFSILMRLFYFFLLRVLAFVEVQFAA
jgi:hypothetical protein